MSDYKKQKYEDLGLGSQATTGNYRALNKNGSFNIVKKNVPFFDRLNFFHTLVAMSWPRFFAVILMSYLGINLLFAMIYYIIGVDQLAGIVAYSELDKIVEAFFFSSQTITTLGYGRIAPVGLMANLIAAIESMLGLLTFALATGLLYGRFSNATAKIRYSKTAVIAPYLDINGFMFRLINLQNNQLMEVEATVTLSLKKVNAQSREFHLLDLERSKVIFMPSSWTIVHPITDKSPLFKITREELLARDAEFITILRAFDESSSQIVYSRSSYTAAEVLWGHKFEPILEQVNGTQILDVGRIDETQPAPLHY